MTDGDVARFRRCEPMLSTLWASGAVAKATMRGSGASRSGAGRGGGFGP